MTERSPIIEVRKPDYHSEIRAYLNNTFAHLQKVNGNHLHEGVEIKPAIESEIFSITDRVESVCSTFQSTGYQILENEKLQLKGPAELALTLCMDGRLDVNQLGKTSKTYKTTAGIMEVEARGDGKILPKPAELCVGIQKTARSGKTLIQGAIVHRKCAAASEIQKNVKENNPYMPEIFSNIDDQYRIGTAQRPEDANRYIVEKTTLAATSDLYNSLRAHEGLEPLKRIGFTAEYDLESRGLIFSENDLTLSTTQLTKSHKEDIERLLGNLIGEYGIHQKDYNQVDNLLLINKKSTKIIETLMKSEEPTLIKYREELRQNINKLYPDFNNEQKQALEFLIDRIESLQYLGGFNGDHSHLKHNEQYISSSRYGEYYGYRDTEQVLGCRVPDPETAGNNIPLQLKVLQGHMPSERPKIYIIGSPADTTDYIQQNKSMDRSRKECLDFFKSFIRHKNVAHLVKSQRLIPLPIIFDENGKILEVPDFSYVV